MYINKDTMSVLTQLQNNSKANIGSLADAINETNNDKQRQIPFKNLQSKGSFLTGTILSTKGMSALEKYKYMAEQSKTSSNIKAAASNPQKALKEANEIIQKAAFAKNQISSNDLIKALIIRQQCIGAVNLSA